MFNNSVPPWGTLLLGLDAAQMTMEWKPREIMERTYSDTFKHLNRKAAELVTVADLSNKLKLDASKQALTRHVVSTINALF